MPMPDWIRTLGDWIRNLVEDMTIDNWISAAQVLVAVVAVTIAAVTIFQKVRADGRTEWWKRYTWAVELTAADTSDEDYDLGIYHLGILSTSKLATATESQIVQDLVISQEIRDNEADRQQEKEADDGKSSED